MTLNKFKKKYSKYKDLEEQKLFSDMEQVYLVEKQRAKKQYQLRWLFYKRKPNFILGKNNYTASERCSKCKKGVSTYLFIWTPSKNIYKCPHCAEDLVKEKNTSIKRKLWNYRNVFWNLLDYLHICRYSATGRYDMLGDECYLVESREYDKDWNLIKINFKKRKWWEHIIIEKPYKS